MPLAPRGAGVGSRQPARHSGAPRQPQSLLQALQHRAAPRCTPSFASGHAMCSQRGGKQPKRRKTYRSLHPFEACQALPQCAHGPSAPMDSAPGSLTQTFFLGTNTPLYLPFAFSDQLLENKPLPAQCRAGARCSTAAGRPSLCSAPSRAADPRHSPLCGHAAGSTAATQVFSTCNQSPRPWPRVTGFHRKWTEGPRGDQGTPYQFKGSRGLQFSLPTVRREVSQETSGC